MAPRRGHNERTQPLEIWLPAFVLKLLVFAAFAFVLFQATVGLGEQELSAGRLWVTIATLVGLLLLLAIDRLTGVKLTPGSLEATLTEAKARALEQAGALEDAELAQALEVQVRQAENPEQVQAAVDLVAKLNVSRVVERIKEGIEQRRKCYIRYRSDAQAAVETFQAAPLDIKPGETPATRINDYLWVHSYEHDGVISLRLDRVLGVELSEETFDPGEVMADWKEREPEWNVPRTW